MKIRAFPDTQKFLKNVESFLMEQEGLNNMILSAALSLAKNPTQLSSAPTGFAVEENDRVLFAALQVRENGILLSTGNMLAAQLLSRYFQSMRQTFKEVHGPEPLAKTFIQVTPMQPYMTLRMFELNQTPAATRAKGRMRVADEADLALLSQWSRNFIVECGLLENPSESDLVTRKYIEARRLFVWTDEDNEVVSMAAYSGLTKNTARVNLVYTPLELRGRSYASGVVTQLSQHLFRQGVKSCILFTDATNPISNAIYEKIGYRQIGEFTQYRASEVNQQMALH